MKVKIISVDTTSCFFHNLTESLDKKITNWLEDNSGVKIISVTPNFHNVTEPDSDMVAIITATIIYE